MIHDAFLRFATNQRPNPSYLGVTNIYPLPVFDPLAALAPNNVLSHDLRAVMDLGNGYPLKMRFDIKSSFTSTDTTLTARFGIAIAPDPDFAGIGQQILSASDRLTVVGGVAGLVPMLAGNFVEVTMPKLSSYHGAGARYVFAVMEIATAITIGNPLFTAGGLDAFLMLDSDAELRQPPHASGFTV